MRSADCAEQCPVLRVKPMLVLSSSQFDPSETSPAEFSVVHTMLPG
jgi:hypothetical protein